MTEITQADRDAAAKAAVLVEFREMIRAGRADHHAEPWAAHREQAERETVARIVAWLRNENGQCDCFARADTECACGAWDDYKTWPLLRVVDAIEQGDWRND